LGDEGGRPLAAHCAFSYLLVVCIYRSDEESTHIGTLKTVCLD
jgi:hypothetical protein